MDQVIRNLINIAIRFAPAAEIVTMSFDLVNTESLSNTISSIPDVVGALQIKVY